jgi:2,4-dienoyl-CoA reductase-like NADH-dependent reductase (Old Yellow Enzyme family)
VRYVDNPPIELTVEHIKKTIQDYVRTAKWAMECGFDGVEVHGGNGYLPEQFLASNVNKRTDAYGGSPEKRCTFTLELMEELSKAIGEENLAIRLSPFGLFNQIRCEQRMETWTTLCRKLKEALPKLSYVSFIEPVCAPILPSFLPSSSPTLTLHSATNRSTANPKNKSSSTPGASARST